MHPLAQIRKQRLVALREIGWPVVAILFGNRKPNRISASHYILVFPASPIAAGQFFINPRRFCAVRSGVVAAAPALRFNGSRWVAALRIEAIAALEGPWSALVVNGCCWGDVEERCEDNPCS